MLDSVELEIGLLIQSRLLLEFAKQVSGFSC